MKQIQWMGDSLEQVRLFSEDGRDKAGRELRRLQMGLQPNDWKPMSSIGLGVQEIRVHSEHEYRVFYVAKFAEALYVLHAFTKKTQETAKHDIDLATKRFRTLANDRK